MIYDIPCIIFAGGKSKRMGSDKSLLSFGGFDTLTQYQLHKLKQIFKKVYISTKNPNKFNFKANFIIDRHDIYAPTAGFASIYENLDVDRFFVIGVDIPFVDKEVIDKIINEDTTNVDATIAKTSKNVESLCGIYHKSLKNDFYNMIKEDKHKLNALLRQKNVKYVEFEEKKFLNLNFIEDYKKAINELNTFR